MSGSGKYDDIGGQFLPIAGEFKETGNDGWRDISPDVPEYPGWVDPIPDKGKVNAASNRTREGRNYNITAAAEGSPIGVVYGLADVAPMIFAVSKSQTSLVLGFAWCIGEIVGMDYLFDGDAEVPASHLKTTYMGTTDQPIDPTLAAAITDYEDTLTLDYLGETHGIAYSVLQLPPDAPLSTRYKAVIRGRKVWDPRLGYKSWTQNPALCLADFISSPLLGLGTPVNETSLIEAANFCDEPLSDDNPRHTLNLAILRQASVDAHIEALRAYANCYIFSEGGEIFLVPQRPAAVVGTLDESLIVDNSLSLEQPAASDTPTLVSIEYSERNVWPWTNTKRTVHHPDVLTGTVPWRESTLSLLGVASRSEATRMARQRLNYFNLVNLKASFSVFDEGFKYQIGDVIQLTHSWGPLNKPMRIVGVDATSPGRWHLATEEYDPLIYSDEVETDPTFPDSGLLPPSLIPPVTGLRAQEILSQLDKGFWSSRIYITWDELDDDYPYPHRFRVIVEAQPFAGVVAGIIHESTTESTSASTPPVQEGAVYKVSVRAESNWGSRTFRSPWASVDILIDGKLDPPGDVADLRVLEAGGELFIEWDPAPDDIDVWRYELRYTFIDGLWEDGADKVIGVVDATRHRTRDVPEGTWDIMLKAIDSVRQYSDYEARATVTVTYDPAYANRIRYDYQEAVIHTNMTEVVAGAGGRCWVSDGGTLWDDAFPDLLETYTLKLVAYTTVGPSEWESETYDWVRPIDGNWSMPIFDAELVTGGTPNRIMALQGTDLNWYEFPDLAIKGPYQKSKARVTSLDNEVLVVCIPTVRVEATSTPKKYTGQAFFDGVTATTIYIDQAVHVVSSIQITPIGSSDHPRFGQPDNIIVGDNPSFDVYIFEEQPGGGAILVPSEFFWHFEAI